MKADRLPSPVPTLTRIVSQKAGSENNSGQEPIGTKVLVLTDQIGEQTAGGITLTPDVIERLTMAVTSGTLVAIGGGGFSDWPNSDRKWPGRLPQIGDRVTIARFAGIVVQGRDGKLYRLLQDVEICGFEVP